VRFVLPLLIALASAGCVSSFKLDTQQGNVVTQEMLDQLKPGMTRSQVRFVLGTPLIADPFHAERWDYVYFFRKGGATVAEQRQVTVVFQGDALLRIEGNVTPRAPGAPAPDSSAGTALKPLADQPAPSAPSRAL
jgi:outer membrane protein assembly factor BamE